MRREEFDVLARPAGAQPLVYLDNASTTQRPRTVLDAVDAFYGTSNANPFRGVYSLSVAATDAYDAARKRVAEFVGADSAEIVFTSGTTEAINLLANTIGADRLSAGDEVLVTELEHHSNLVPWQMLCRRTGAKLSVLPIDDRGELQMERLADELSSKTKVVACAHVSNSLGTLNDVTEVVSAAKAVGAITVVDGAQAVAHVPVDVRALDCDFYAFSSHKMYGPMGVGALYGRRKLLESMPPWQSGGDMVQTVTFEETTFRDAPFRFEAGTPNVAGAVGLAAAIDFLAQEDPSTHEAALLARAVEALDAAPGVRLIGRPSRRIGVVSFVVDGVHAHDVATVLDTKGIAVRSGHHCTQPVMDHFGVPATVRVSFAMYNELTEIDRLVEGLEEVRRIFG